MGSNTKKTRGCSGQQLSFPRENSESRLPRCARLLDTALANAEKYSQIFDANDTERGVLGTETVHSLVALRRPVGMYVQ